MQTIILYSIIHVIKFVLKYIFKTLIFYVLLSWSIVISKRKTSNVFNPDRINFVYSVYKKENLNNYCVIGTQFGQALSNSAYNIVDADNYSNTSPYSKDQERTPWRWYPNVKL